MSKKEKKERQTQEEERLNIIREFGNKLVNSQKDIPQEFLEIANKNFWDLLY